MRSTNAGPVSHYAADVPPPVAGASDDVAPDQRTPPRPVSAHLQHEPFDPGPARVNLRNGEKF